MIRYDFKQRSEEWQKARLGIPTSSEFKRIVTPKKCELSKQAEGYMHVLLAEWILGAPLPSVETEYMIRGAQLEDEAVRAYEFETGLTTERVGFVTTDDGLIGCSPDRLVYENGKLVACLECKCPAANTHVGYLLSRQLDEEHAPQTQGQLRIMDNIERVDTISYYPGLPLVVIRTPRREDYIDSLKSALDSFVATMLSCRDRLTQSYGPFTRPKPAANDIGALGVSDEDVSAIWEGRLNR